MARSLAILACAVLACPAHGAVLSVPDRYWTIEEAASRARPGDTIDIAPGTYSPLETSEMFPVFLEVDDVTIRGAGPDHTILDASGLGRHFVVRASVRIEGLTLRGGSSSTFGGSLSVEEGTVDLAGLVFRDNSATAGGSAIAWNGGDGRVANCLFVRNGPLGPTIRVAGGEPVLEFLTWHRNAGPALGVIGGGPTLRRSIVSQPGNPSGNAHGVVIESGARPRLTHNLFDRCFDGTLSLPDDVPRALLKLLDEARRDGGLREGDPLFENVENFDFRLRDASPALVGEQAGALGGRDPLDMRPKPPVPVIASGVDEMEPDATILGPTVPNPFAPATTIHFTMSEPSVVDLAVYNILGQRVRTLYAGDLSAGEHSRPWDGRDERGVDAPGGIYFVRITRGDVTESQRIVLMR